MKGIKKLRKGKPVQDDVDADEDESDGQGVPDGGGDPKRKKKKKKKKKGDVDYSADVDAAHSKINLEALSKKEEPFQIRFIIHKARRLSGAISLPLVRIHLDKKVLRTKPRKGKNPIWNETVLFSINKSELELIATPIEIRVIDSIKSAQYSLIGLYNCDLSVAWVSKDKNLFFKWFALTNPDEPQDGMTGYVNMSIQIIPPGETAKDLPKLRDEEIDVSSNVYFPPGLSLQPGQFVVKLINGEDMPQMDSSYLAGVKDFLQGNADKKTELVDPYAKIEFAGVSVESSVHYCTFDPIWNEQLVIPGEFPSMAEKIVIKVYDNDDYAIDDLIATKLLVMDEISYPSSDALLGFSPTFGPAYIPFYGSIREFNEIYDEFADLNHGALEGIAYRGRVLLEIKTRMGPPPEGEKQLSPMVPAETDSIMAKLRRHKYHLFVSFYQGNMIYETENQVEFEVSIGDYGNKMSPHASPAPSTTQPCNAVYDGFEYHFMPWGRSKPTVILHSQWEDIQERVEALNTLIWMKDFMKEKMGQYNVLARAFVDEYDLDIKLENNLTDILSALKTLPLEEPDEDMATELDKKLYQIRMFTINNLIDEVEGMLTGRLKDMTKPEKLKRLAAVKEKMDDLCYEPQLGIPDIFIWMLSGTKRLAYTRIPINDIMYSKSKFGRGKHCGNTGSFFLKLPKDKKERIGAHLTLSLWFGKFEHVNETFKPPRGSEVTVYAESYENEMSMLGSWTTKLLPRPHFSDSTGKYSLPLECFIPPDGWEFQSGWFISVDRSLTFDNETGLNEFMEEVFEGRTRLPGAQWTGPFGSEWWSDNKGDDAPHKNELDCREGWQWSGDWEVDCHRAVDAQGWEYAVDTSIASYGPIERGYHLSRRRQWQRKRLRTEEESVSNKRVKDFDPEGWEYSKIFTTKFHPKERKFDMVRRRRYNRKLVSSVPMPVVFKITKEEAKKDSPAEVFNMAPRIITEYNERQIHKYQLRAYIYQGRGILGADPTGYSDPYARVVFGNRSASTKVIQESVSPVWDTTLVLDSVEICGLPEDVACNPPFIVVELFDEDVLEHDQLGRVVCKPAVFNTGPYKCTKLAWYPIGGIKRSKGDILAAFELFKLGGIELPHLPAFVDLRYLVPSDIRPKLQLTRVEVLTWGVRLMKDYKMIPVESPQLDIEVGGMTLSIDKIDSVKKHPNFSSPHAYVDLELPINEEFLPPINLRIMDNRSFGYTPLVAVATIKEYGQFRTTYNLHSDPESALLDLQRPESERKMSVLATVLADQVDPSVLLAHLTDENGDQQVEGAPKDTTDVDDNTSFTVADTEGLSAITPIFEREKISQNGSVGGKKEKGSQNGSVVGDGDDKGSQHGSAVDGEQEAPLKDYSGDLVIGNPAAVVSETADNDSVVDITITIPQTVIDAAQAGVAAKEDKQLKKDLKKQEKMAKKEARLHKKKLKMEAAEHQKNVIAMEKQRQKKAREQAKAKYKAEQDAKKKALEALANEESDEEFIPSDPEPAIKFDETPTILEMEPVPDKAAGLLGMWYGTGDGQSPEDGADGNKLSRKETRKIKKLEEEEVSHPDDILVSDWWSKYYHCIGADSRLDAIFKERHLPTIKLYEEELEAEHNQFRDLMEVIPLCRPDNEVSTDGSFKIYRITEEMRQQAENDHPRLLFSNLPDNKPSDVIVRLYVVAGMNLTPLDFGGSVDPYLWVKCGKTVKDDKANYQPKKTDPTFGKMFEIRASLPRDSKLLVKVYDHDLIGANDLIGCTSIDLEDRFLSWKRASCGVASQYIIDRESKDCWRDFMKPVALLKRMCLLKGWGPPTFKGKGQNLRCYVNLTEYKLKYFESGHGQMTPTNQKKFGPEEHRLALHVLLDLEVVPEHVETRTLYNDDCPGIPQGKLHLWVDIFPYDRNLPPPVNIQPRIAEKMVLRLIIWNTQDVKLDDTNIMGEQMSDIFVKCHLEGMDKDSQETDVHYRSLTGEGNFNWRMVYNFNYLMAEQKIVHWKRQSFFSHEKSESKLDPILHLRVYDYDIFSSDDLLGWAELNLVSLPSPTKGHKECDLSVYDTPTASRISIFDKKKIKGFWPVFDDSMGERELTGKVEIELEILTEEEALERPAGKAREEPNLNPTLEPPNRPATSFNWFTNPLMVFKIMIWGRYKWHILGFLLFLLLLVFVGLLIYTSPQAINQAIFSG